MATILYGKPVREKMIEEIKERITNLGFSPTLAILQVGEREDSTAYIKQKQKFGTQIGAEVVLKQWREVDQENLEQKIIAEIESLNKDENINGIIVQLPLPENLNTERILNALSELKDADGLKGLREDNESLLVTPATAGAVLALLDFYKIEVNEKRVAVVGRSRLAGGPIATELERRGASVRVCHRETVDNEKVCRESEVLIVAAGQVGLVTKNFVNKDQVVIDVGINRIIPLAPFTLKGEQKKSTLVGDVDFAEVEPIVKAISPVPGGVGPLTVACLFRNLVDLCYNDGESFKS